MTHLFPTKLKCILIDDTLHSVKEQWLIVQGSDLQLNIHELFPCVNTTERMGRLLLFPCYVIDWEMLKLNNMGKAILLNILG